MKQLEITAFEKNDITVYYKIDYKSKKISLVEFSRGQCQWVDKKWLFSGREIEYMNGWSNTLQVMELAISEAKDKLEESINEEASYIDKIYEDMDKDYKAFLDGNGGCDIVVDTAESSGDITEYYKQK